jgi:integrase
VLNDEKGKHPDRVFTYKGRPLGQVNTRSWRNALKRAGIKNFRWHDLRHVWATWHVMAGTTMAELQELGAWKSALMVKRYAHSYAQPRQNLLRFRLQCRKTKRRKQRKVLNNWLPDQGSNLGPAD